MYRECLTHPDETGFVQLTPETRKEIGIRLEIARQLAALAQSLPREMELFSYGTGAQSAALSDGPMHITVYGHNANGIGLTNINIISIRHPEILPDTVIHLGWRALADPHGLYASEVLGQPSSNDHLWGIELDKHMISRRANPSTSGTFYEGIKGRHYLGFALGGDRYPQPVDYLLADPRLYHGAFDDVLVSRVKPFIDCALPLLCTENRGTIFFAKPDSLHPSFE